jgi:predicted metal-dependent hydrolase
MKRPASCKAAGFLRCSCYALMCWHSAENKKFISVASDAFSAILKPRRRREKIMLFYYV